MLVGTAVIATAAVLTVATAGTGTALACFAAGALKGAGAGAASGAISGAVTGAVAHRITTGSWEGAGQAALDGAATGYMTGAITGFITGGLTSDVCFVAGTSVLTASGHVAIETVKIGDMVWAEDPETGEKALKRVVQTFVNETNELVHVFVNGEEIISTPEHPFYVPQKGWTAAIQLRAGDSLVLSNGKYVIVERIQHEILESPITVYNFEVEDFHTYYVGENGILVHNLCNGKWTSAGKGASSNANYHFNKHGYEVGARTLQEYTTKATNFANQVLQKGIKGKYVSGATANTYRYVFNGKYVDMAWNGVEYILVSFGKVVR